MKNLRLISGKRGSIVYIYIIFIFVSLLILCITMIAIFRLNVFSKAISLKKDLFYIGQNCSSIAMENNLLSYNEYKIDEEKMYKLASELISRNYGQDIRLDSISYDYSKNILTIRAIIMIKPNMLFINLDKVEIPISQDVKVKLMEVD